MLKLINVNGGFGGLYISTFESLFLSNWYYPESLKYHATLPQLSLIVFIPVIHVSELFLYSLCLKLSFAQIILFFSFRLFILTFIWISFPYWILKTLLLILKLDQIYNEDCYLSSLYLNKYKINISIWGQNAFKYGSFLFKLKSNITLPAEGLKV